MKRKFLKLLEDFNDGLYRSKGTPSHDEFYQFTSDLNLPKIPDDEQEMLEGLLSFEECKKALESLNRIRSHLARIVLL